MTAPEALTAEDGAFDFWAPPRGHASADWDRELGSPADRILLEGGGSSKGWERTMLRARISELPQALRLLMRRIQQPFLALQVLDWIESHLNHLARKEGAFVVAYGLNMPGSQSYIPAIDRRRFLQALGTEGSFVEEAAARACEALKLAHETAVFASWPRPLPIELPDALPPSEGTWCCESWLGLAHRMIAEDLPEGALVGTSQRLWQSLQALRRPANLLHWGALSSSLTVALMATRPPSVWPANIHEVETLGQPQDLSWVRSRSHELPREPTAFDAVVCHLPPPGDGANQWRNRYKNLGTATDQERRLPDMGRLGPRKWKKARRRLLGELAQRLGIGAELVLFHPLAVRTVEIEAGSRPRWSYRAAPELAAVLLDELGALDLDVIADAVIEELNPVFVAPFGPAKCLWWCVIARSSGTLGTTDRTVDAAVHEVIGRG